MQASHEPPTILTGASPVFIVAAELHVICCQCDDYRRSRRQEHASRRQSRVQRDDLGFRQPIDQAVGVDLSQVEQDDQGRSENCTSKGGAEGISWQLFWPIATVILYRITATGLSSFFNNFSALSARIRAFFVEGVEVFGMSIAVDTLPAILHTSIFLLLAGLVV